MRAGAPRADAAVCRTIQRNARVPVAFGHVRVTVPAQGHGQLRVIGAANDVMGFEHTAFDRNEAVNVRESAEQTRGGVAEHAFAFRAARLVRNRVERWNGHLVSPVVRA